jgi:hypothetical protein
MAAGVSRDVGCVADVLHDVVCLEKVVIARAVERMLWALHCCEPRPAWRVSRAKVGPLSRRSDALKIAWCVKSGCRVSGKRCRSLPLEQQRERTRVVARVSRRLKNVSSALLLRLTSHTCFECASAP